MDFQKKYLEIRERAEASLKGTGHSLEDILVIAVTKTIPAETVQDAVNAGFLHLGENRVQELLQKSDRIKGSVRWHLIGSLQRNKVKYILDRVDLIHSLDSLRLASEIQRLAAAADRTVSVLAQVNIGREPAKSGIDPKELPQFLNEMASYPNLEIQGLMAIPPYHPDPQAVRPFFRRMKDLYDASVRIQGPNIRMQWLSMGMTHDYEIALSEGANMIRIGTGIFGART